MIQEGAGNLLTAEVEALVNTVNTVGVMGKGIALQFKRAHPDNYRAYRAACVRGEVRLGRMFVVDTGALGPRRYIVNFPTKKHWRSGSRLTDIEAGLDDLVRVVGELGVTSIAIPPLGSPVLAFARGGHLDRRRADKRGLRPDEWAGRAVENLPLGGVDAAVVAIAEQFGLAEVATLDRRHFSVVRPRHVSASTLRP